MVPGALGSLAPAGRHRLTGCSAFYFWCEEGVGQLSPEGRGALVLEDILGGRGLGWGWRPDPGKPFAGGDQRGLIFTEKGESKGLRVLTYGGGEGKRRSVPLSLARRRRPPPWEQVSPPPPNPPRPQHSSATHRLPLLSLHPQLFRSCPGPGSHSTPRGRACCLPGGQVRPHPSSNGVSPSAPRPLPRPPARPPQARAGEVPHSQNSAMYQVTA